MAHITLTGTLLTPAGKTAYRDQIRFTHKSTTGETVRSSVDLLTIIASGFYHVELEYGLVLIEYKSANDSQFKNLGVATVNDTNPSTSIPELLNGLVPVSSAELIQFQAILADAVAAKNESVTAKNEAQAFAASIDLINDLSQAYEFKTMALFKASDIALPEDKPVYVREFSSGSGGGEIYYVALTSTVTPDDIDVFQSVAVPSISIVKAEYGQVSGDINKKYVKVAAVIRNTGSGWFFITDSGHNNIRFGAISTRLDGTVVIQNPPNCKTIGSVLVGADETYTKIGITAGASVSLVETVITFAAPLNARIDTSTAPPTVLTPAHFLINGVGVSRFTAQVNSNNIALNHASKEGGSNFNVSMQTSSPLDFIDVSLSYIDNQTTQFYFTKDLYGYCSYDGSAWQLSGNNGSVNPVFTTDTLTLTHESSEGRFDRQLSGRYPFNAYLDSISNTVTKVKFTDVSTGTLQTTESTNMRFTYNIGSVNPISGGVIKEDIGNVTILGGNVQVMSQDLINPLGNFWIEGIFEV